MIGFTAALATSGAGAGASQDQRFDVSQLGPEPFLAAPATLDRLVKDVPAAVVAEIVGPGTLKFESVEVPHSTKRSVRGCVTYHGYVTYHAVIREVLFNKDQSAPPLTAGAKMEFAQNVGQENAEAFLADLTIDLAKRRAHRAGRGRTAS